MKETIYSVLLIIGLLVLAGLLFGAPVMVLWNLLMPDIFGLPVIGFWQAFGLNLLFSILFKATVKVNEK
jgi:hypothetical protein